MEPARKRTKKKANKHEDKLCKVMEKRLREKLTVLHCFGHISSSTTPDSLSFGS